MSLLLKFANEAFDIIAQVELDGIPFNGPTDEFKEAVELRLAGHYGKDPQLLMVLLTKLEQGDYFIMDTTMKQYVYQPDVMVVDNMDDLNKMFTDVEHYDHQERTVSTTYTVEAPRVEPMEDELPNETTDPADESVPEETPSTVTSTVKTAADEKPALVVNYAMPDKVAAAPRRRRKKSELTVEQLEAQLLEYQTKVNDLKSKIDELKRQHNEKRSQFKALLAELLSTNSFLPDETSLAQSLLDTLTSNN